MIEYIPNPQFKAIASLHFLESGHYLFRYTEEDREASKFVTAPDVAAAFSMKEIDSGWLPAGIVRCGQNAAGPWFVYSTPAQKVKISLDEGIWITVPAPRLALIGSGNTYYLAAIRAKRFEGNVMVYHAPFPNVYADGRICWGTNTPPEAQPENARQAWDLFFESPFNGDLVGQKSNTYSKDVRGQLRELEVRQARNYPGDDLLSMNIDVLRLAQKVIGGGR
jgi:hypothetical protein